ncbi:MAG: efflux RND transporter periplasmic adaptor subunit [Bacteroidota bacterium]
MGLFLWLIWLPACQSSSDSGDPYLKEADSRIVPSAQGVHVACDVIRSSDFDRQILSNGKIRAKEQTVLTFKTSEKVAKIHVTNGQFVQRGQEIARLDDQLALYKLEEAKSLLEQAQHQMYLLKVERGKEAVPTDELSEDYLKTLRNISGYTKAQNRISLAKIEFSYTRLIAPFSGKIADLNIQIGDYVTAAKPFCKLLGRQQQVWFSLLEREVEDVQIGQEVVITSFSGAESVKGKISEINPSVDKFGLVEVKADLAKGQSMLEGSNVKVFINSKIKDLLVVPREAIVNRSNKDVVFVCKEGLAKWHNVKIVEENSHSYAIKYGTLQLGDTIITSGNLNLSHDSRVHVINSF